MPKKISLECEAVVKAFSKDNLSQRAIKDKVNSLGFEVSQSTISNILNSVGISRQAISLGQKVPPNKYPRVIRTPAFIRKVANMTTRENPKSQRNMAKLLGTSQATIQKVIKVDLKLNTRRKVRVHVLKPHHIKNRRTAARKLYEKHLAGKKFENVVTLDEGWFYIANCDGKRRICYRRKGEKVPSNWVVEKGESYGEKIMVVGAMSGKGVLPLRRVPQNVKINSHYYIEEVLKPWLEVEIPKLYGNDTKNVVVHHDQASSHMSKETAAYAAGLKSRLGITILDKSEIPVKSPDISPMDFFGFGFMKQRLFSRKPKTLEGLWKVIKEDWSKVTPQMVLNVMKSWKRRCRLVKTTKGGHIESITKIHYRKLKKQQAK